MKLRGYEMVLNVYRRKIDDDDDDDDDKTTTSSTASSTDSSSTTSSASITISTPSTNSKPPGPPGPPGPGPGPPAPGPPTPPGPPGRITSAPVASSSASSTTSISSSSSSSSSSTTTSSSSSSERTTLSSSSSSPTSSSSSTQTTLPQTSPSPSPTPTPSITPTPTIGINATLPSPTSSPSTPSRTNIAAAIILPVLGIMLLILLTMAFIRRQPLLAYLRSKRTSNSDDGEKGSDIWDGPGVRETKRLEIRRNTFGGFRTTMFGGSGRVSGRVSRSSSPELGQEGPGQHLGEVLTRHGGDEMEGEGEGMRPDVPSKEMAMGTEKPLPNPMPLIPTIYIPPDQRNIIRASLETIPESLNTGAGVGDKGKGKEMALDEAEMGEVAKVRSWA